jgi:hypothetical protein
MPFRWCASQAGGSHARRLSAACRFSTCHWNGGVTPGQPSSAAHAASVIGWIAEAARLVMAGEAGGMVTGPIQKETLYQAGFSHQGHTDYLAHLARQAGHEAEPVMMLSAANLSAPFPSRFTCRWLTFRALCQVLPSLRKAASFTAIWPAISASRPRASLLPVSTRMPAKAAALAPRIATSLRLRCCLAQRGHQRQWPALGRHHVPRRSARTI